MRFVPEIPDDVAALSYEDARDELIAIVATLEAGTATLDESLGLWERGEALAARCQQVLDGAQQRVEAVRDPDDAGVVGIALVDGSDEPDEAQE